MKTVRQVYESVLLELNKREAPSILLDDFNYYLNKAIGQYINKKYNSYDVNQQSDDDLDELKIPDYEITLNKIGIRYKGTLPSNYLHILNCTVKYTIASNYRCYEQGDIVEFSAGRLPTTAARQVEQNYYYKPSYKNPYFYKDSSLLEIRSGNDNIFVPTTVYIDYLRTPIYVELTEEDIEEVQDTSQEMEFKDYVVQEIINELVKLLMELSSDPRIQTNIPINQTIGSLPRQQK